MTDILLTNILYSIPITVKLGDKEQLQIRNNLENSKTTLPVYFINSEQPGVREERKCFLAYLKFNIKFARIFNFFFQLLFLYFFCLSFLEFFAFKHHVGGSQQQKLYMKTSKLQETFFAGQLYFFCAIYIFLLMSNKNLRFFLLSNITQGVVNSKKMVRNALNPSRTFFAGQLYFFQFDLRIQ